MKRVILTIFSIGFYFLSSAQIAWPGITQETKPWARWWWQGSAVNKKNLSANMKDYKAAGLGGLEITPIYGVMGYEKEFISFLSPQWMQMLDYTLKEAKNLGLGMDMANGTGWPFGGPTVTNKDAAKTVVYKTYELKGGEELNDPVVYEQEGFVRTANGKSLKITEVKKPVTANEDLQALAIDQIKYPEQLPLKLLMAYSDDGQKINLTNKINTQNKLEWKALPGNWTLYALFEGMHGKMVERAAPGGEGYAIDHFSAEALRNYFKRFDTAFKGHDISYIRALFNDSYEVDDARGQSNWTPLLFKEFQQRRGYDLRNYLPALFGKASPEMNSRVIFDYRTTIDELILEKFTIEWKKWGDTKGAIIRNQSHGSPANLLDLYGAIDIPETEGDDILRFKFATSAAHVTGKRLASSESATWLNEHFLSSWGDVRKKLDLFFLGGVNHIFYHGVNYSPKEAPWPGWLFYAATHFQQTNPQWKDFGALNSYVTRVQSFLQKGAVDNDVLLYCPINDRYADPGKALLQHFDNMEHEFKGTDFEKLSAWMQDHGYTFDFFSDRQLQKMDVTSNKIITANNSYQTILLPANKYLTVKSFQKLINLAKEGATILVYKNLPQEVPGLSQLEENKKVFSGLLNQLSFSETNGVKKAIVGKGVFIMADEIDVLLQAALVRKENLQENGLSFLRRKNSEGFTYFLNNRTEKAFDGWIALSGKAASVALFDPVSEKLGLAKWRKNSEGKVEVYVQLQPFESCLLQTYNTAKTGQPYLYLQPAAGAKSLEGSWTVEFVSGGPVLPKKLTVNKLDSWTTWEGEDLKSFSGTAKYTLQFAKPTARASNWLLDLGAVKETAEVFLNGKKLATLIGPSFQLVLPAADIKGTNKLEILVSNLMANRISYMDRNDLPWKIFYNINMPARKAENSKNGLFDASKWSPLPSGLLGPVTLTPLK